MSAYNALFPKPNTDSLPLPSPRLLLSCAAPNKQQTAVTELYPSAWKFPQRRIIKSDFPALLSDVMPLWLWVNSRGLYKEERMYLKCHPAAGARLCYSPPHMCAAEADIRSASLICIAAHVDFSQTGRGKSGTKAAVSRLASARVLLDERWLPGGLKQP